MADANGTGPPRRRRVMGSMSEFVGGTGAAEEVPAEAPRTVSPGLDDDLDPSGRPYRRATDERAGDPHLGGGNLGTGWGRIVRTVFRLDEEAAFARLNKIRFLTPPSRMEYGQLIDELDQTSESILLASQLYENARVVLRLYDADVEALRAPMRKKAKAELAAEKQAGGGKQITNDDVTAKMAELWPDEWRRQEENLAKAKGAVAHCGEMFERWKSRAKEIDGMVRTVRKV